jgi:folylpolyglutamate synthase/dihydropteroate synthase
MSCRRADSGQRNGQDQTGRHNAAIDPIDNRKAITQQHRSPQQHLPHQSKNDGAAKAAAAHHQQGENHTKQEVRQCLQNIHLIQRIQKTAEENRGPRPIAASQPIQNEAAKRQLLTQSR